MMKLKNPKLKKGMKMELSKPKLTLKTRNP